MRSEHHKLDPNSPNAEDQIEKIQEELSALEARDSKNSVVASRLIELAHELRRIEKYGDRLFQARALINESGRELQIEDYKLLGTIAETEITEFLLRPEQLGRSTSISDSNGELFHPTEIFPGILSKHASSKSIALMREVYDRSPQATEILSYTYSLRFDIKEAREGFSELMEIAASEQGALGGAFIKIDLGQMIKHSDPETFARMQNIRARHKERSFVESDTLLCAYYATLLPLADDSRLLEELKAAPLLHGEQALSRVLLPEIAKRNQGEFDKELLRLFALVSDGELAGAVSLALAGNYDESELIRTRLAS